MTQRHSLQFLVGIAEDRRPDPIIVWRNCFAFTVRRGRGTNTHTHKQEGLSLPLTNFKEKGTKKSISESLEWKQAEVGWQNKRENVVVLFYRSIYYTHHTYISLCVWHTWRNGKKTNGDIETPCWAGEEDVGSRNSVRRGGEKREIFFSNRAWLLWNTFSTSTCSTTLAFGSRRSFFLSVTTNELVEQQREF